MSGVSATCFSSVCSGLSEVIGSWKTIAIRLPRTSRNRAGAAPTSSSPAKRMLLSGVCEAAGWGRSCKIDSAVTDFPEPLSPTSARVSPRSSGKDARFTASTGGAPRAPRKVTLRSRTSNRLTAIPAPPASGRLAGGTPALLSRHHLARIEGVAHRLADENEQAEHHRQNSERGDPEPRRLQIGLALREQLAERRRARRQAKAEKIERGQGGDRAVKDERHERDCRHCRVRQDMPEDDDRVGDAKGSRRAHVIEVARA